MTVREFAKIAAKLLGAYFFIEGIARLIIALNGLVMRIVRSDFASDSGGDFLSLIWLSTQPAVYIVAAAVLILKTDWVLKILKIDLEGKQWADSTET